MSILKKTNPFYQLQNIGKFVADDDSRFSNWFDKNKNCLDDGNREHSLIDHILMSPGLANTVEEAKYYHDYAVTCDQRVSDHWPMLVTLNLDKYVA
jgi:exonuclease III